MVSFLPWCRVNKTYDLGQIKISPFQRHKPIEGIDEAAQCRVNTILGTYKTIKGEPIDSAALVRYEEKSFIDDLSKAERETIHELAALACFSALAKREYFNPLGPYCNSECFALYFQKFDSADFITLATRRRDGKTWSSWPIDDIAITVPVHCHTVSEVHLDEGLLRALVAHRTQSREAEWATWQNAISCFNQANTDSEAVRFQVEWVLLCSAFEHILGAKSKYSDVARKFADAMAPSSSVLMRNAERRSDQWTGGDEPLRYEWMREFYRIRGDFAHGKLQTGQPAMWNPSEHLVLAAIAFPLLVRCLLKENGGYEFTDNDLAQIDAFEGCADQQFLDLPADQSNSLDSVWSRCVNDAKFEASMKRILDDPEIKGLWEQQQGS